MKVFWLLLAVLWPPSSSAEPVRKDAELPPAEAVSAGSISKSIGELIEGKRPIDSLRLRVEWRRDQKMVSAELFGSGVGIWNSRTQFRLSSREVLAFLESLQKSGFGSMPSMYGERSDMLVLKGMVSVTIGPLTKIVHQLAEGDQSDALMGVARNILSLSEQRAKNGVSVSSLAEGLQKLAQSKLQPEAFALVAVLRKESAGTGTPGEEGGWLLRLTGRQARAQPFVQGKGYGAPRGLTLSPKEFQKIISLLRREDPAGLPQNLFAPQYTELRLQVLDQVKDLVARPYADVSPELHGKHQRSFDEICEALRALEQRVQQEGQEEVPAEDPPEPEKDEEPSPYFLSLR